MNDNTLLDKFLGDKQKKLGRPLSIIDFLNFTKEFWQTIDKGENSKISDEQFLNNKRIVDITMEFILKNIELFGITEKNGYLITYLEDNDGTGKSTKDGRTA